MKIIHLPLLLFIATTSYCGVEQLEGPISVHRKNFSHKLTPVTTFGFGQNIIDKRTLIFYPFAYFTQGDHSHLVQIAPVLLYGITDWLSIYGELPITLSRKNGSTISRGIENCIIQLEYLFMEKKSSTLLDQVTLVANISPATSHLSSSGNQTNTTTSLSNSTSLFLGTTASHLSLEWYLYAALGATINISKNNSKNGNTLFYQWGVGHYLGNPWGLTFAGIIEFNGTYVQKDRICTGHLHNSGGNTLLIGPSLFLASDRLQIIGGIQFPALQQLNGRQFKQHLASIISIAIVF